jgi:hypothetical protein
MFSLVLASVLAAGPMPDVAPDSLPDVVPVMLAETIRADSQSISTLDTVCTAGECRVTTAPPVGNACKPCATCAVCARGRPVLRAVVGVAKIARAVKPVRHTIERIRGRREARCCRLNR